MPPRRAAVRRLPVGRLERAVTREGAFGAKGTRGLLSVRGIYYAASAGIVLQYQRALLG